MKYVVYATDTGFTIYREKKTQGDELSTVLWKETQKVDDFLFQLTPKDEVYILLDSLEEELSFEWSPKVMPWEKGALLKRRLERAKNDSVALVEVKPSQAERKSKDGRKEELILTASVSNIFNLENVLTKFKNANVLLKAIYSKPYLIKHFFENVSSGLNLPKNHSKFPLLITSRKSQHKYRQTFIFDGTLRLSRMVELDEYLQENVEIQDALMNETRLAVSYVYNQKILPFDAPFAMFFLDSNPEILQDLEQVALKRKLISETWVADEYFFSTALFSDLFKETGFYCQQLESEAYFSEQAMVDYIMHSQPKGFYRTEHTKKIETLFLVRKGMISTNIALSLGLVAFVALSSVDSYLKWQELGMLDERIVAHDVEKKRLESLVQLKDDAQTIKSSVEFSESILKLKLGRIVGFDIQKLSETLVKHSNIQISDIKWSNKERFDSKLYEISFNGWVFPFYETYQKPIQWIDELVADLEKVPGIEQVNLTKEPLNRNLNQAVTINTDKGKVKALPFSITLRLKDGQSK